MSAHTQANLGRLHIALGVEQDQALRPSRGVERGAMRVDRVRSVLPDLGDAQIKGADDDLIQ
jgi:hypothetical protein